MEYADKRVIVLGLGKTGEAVKRYLQSRGASVRCYDDSIAREGLSDLSVTSDFAVVSPGFPLENPVARALKERGVPILSELDLAYINRPSERIYAVTGTNGKTTTCTILHEMLSTVGRSHLVGNVGTPFVSALDLIRSKDAVVVEVSSFQIEQSSVFRPAVAALTVVGEDHLDRHGSVQRYQRLKLSLAERAEIAVLNADDPVQRDLGGVRYSVRDERADYCLSGRTITVRGKKYPLAARSRGAAFDMDYLCAFAVACTAYGVRKEFLSAYDRVVLPRYRFEKVGTINGGAVYNDSKGTNVDATLFALSHCKGETALILGGSDKGEDYSRLMRGAERASRIYLVGGNARELYLAASDEVRRKCLPMADLESVVSHFAADPLDTLLFSPACASFDRYENYEQRGREFDEIVQKYLDGHE